MPVSYPNEIESPQGRATMGPWTRRYSKQLSLVSSIQLN